MQNDDSAVACEHVDDVMVGLEGRAERNSGKTEVNSTEFQHVLDQKGRDKVNVQLTIDNTRQCQGPYEGQFKSQCRFQQNGAVGYEFNVYTTKKVNWEV